MPATFDAAIQFYHSRQWRNLAEAYRKQHNYLCERCHQPASTVHHIKELTPANINDPSVALNPDNLMLVCHECHDKIHERFQQRKPEPRKIMFDKDGNVIAADPIQD